MSGYTDDFRAEVAGIIAETQAGLQAEGLIFAEREVKVVTEVRTGGNPARGVPPTVASAELTLSPRPKVDLREQWRDGQKVADGKLTSARAALPIGTLAGASYLLIDGERYTLAAGYVKRRPFVWEVLVTRARQ